MGRRGMGVGWVMAKLKQMLNMTQIVECRVAMMCTCTHNAPVFQGLDRCAVMVEAISGHHSQI